MSKIQDIQSGYYEIVQKYFGSVFAQARKYNVSSDDLARDMMGISSIRKATEEDLEGTFGIEIRNFWVQNFDDLLTEIQNLQGSRLYYSGDISPSNSGIVNRLGLYADTIILPDPALRTLGPLLKGVMDPTQKSFLALKHIIRLHEYKEAALANTGQPILLFFPSELVFEMEGLKDKLTPLAEQKTTDYLNENLNVQCKDFGEWLEFFSQMKSIEDFKKIVKNNKAFLFDSNVTDDLDSQLDALIKSNDLLNDKVLSYINKGLITIPFSIYGRIGQSLWHLTKSNLLNSHPVQDAFVSWHYLRWEMGSGKDSDPVPYSLTQEKFEFLSKIPISSLVKLREHGELQDLRNVISKEINSESDSVEVVKQIQYNIRTELIKHQKQVGSLDEKYRKALKLDIPSMIGGVTLGVLGAVSNPWFAVPSAILGGSGLIDAGSKYLELRSAKKDLSTSVWGFFADNDLGS